MFEPQTRKAPDLSCYVSQDRLICYWLSEKGRAFLKATANPANSIAVTESSVIIGWEYVRSFLKGVDRASLRFRIRGL
jgi:hypothetical protein